jgi:hypothetical protein
MRIAPKFSLVRHAALAAVLFTSTAGSAHAYIDPGTGSMLLQVIGAGIAGAIFYFRELRIKVTSMFSRRPEPGAGDSPESPPGDSAR